MPHDLNHLEELELSRRRHVMMPDGQLPPLPTSRVAQHIEETRAYRAEHTTMKGVEIAARLAKGVRRLHEDNMRGAGSDPVLGQLLYRIEAALTVTGCELITRYMERAAE